MCIHWIHTYRAIHWNTLRIFKQLSVLFLIQHSFGNFVSKGKVLLSNKIQQHYRCFYKTSAIERIIQYFWASSIKHKFPTPVLCMEKYMPFKDYFHLDCSIPKKIFLALNLEIMSSVFAWIMIRFSDRLLLIASTLANQVGSEWHQMLLPKCNI